MSIRLSGIYLYLANCDCFRRLGDRTDLGWALELERRDQLRRLAEIGKSSSEVFDSRPHKRITADPPIHSDPIRSEPVFLRISQWFAFGLAIHSYGYAPYTVMPPLPISSRLFVYQRDLRFRFRFRSEFHFSSAPNDKWQP